MGRRVALAVLVCVALSVWARVSAQDRPAPVVCADPEDCPASVALLSVRQDGGGTASCTAFLVGPDRLVTASHCVPDLVQRGLVPCSEALVAHFPALPHAAAEDVACASVTHVSPLVEEALMAIDYAVLRLRRPVARAPLTLSRAGVGDGQSVHLWVADPGDPAVVHRRDCRASQSTVDFPPFDRDGAPTVMARGCGTLHGNSGSPLVDDAGVVRAVVTGLGRTGAGHLRREGGPLVRLVDDRGEMTFATNLAAIPDPRDLGARPRGADWMEGTLVASLEARITPVFVQSSLAKLRSAAEARLAEWAAMTRTPLEWRVVAGHGHGLRRELTATPICLRAGAERPRRVSVPVWRAELERDDDHHVVAHATEVRRRSVSVRALPVRCPDDPR